jgi:hypothetical protein
LCVAERRTRTRARNVDKITRGAHGFLPDSELTRSPSKQVQATGMAVGQHNTRVPSPRNHENVRQSRSRRPTRARPRPPCWRAGSGVQISWSGCSRIFPEVYYPPPRFDPIFLASVRSDLGCEKLADRIFGPRHPGVSESYAADIRAGRRLPHPRHWEALAKLAGVSL